MLLLLTLLACDDTCKAVYEVPVGSYKVVGATSETELMGATVTVTEDEVVITYTEDGVEQRVVYAVQDRDTGAR
jgi:hypothetical protein